MERDMSIYPNHQDSVNLQAAGGRRDQGGIPARQAEDNSSGSLQQPPQLPLAQRATPSSPNTDVYFPVTTDHSPSGVHLTPRASEQRLGSSLHHHSSGDPSHLYHANIKTSDSINRLQYSDLQRGQSSIGLMDSFSFPQQQNSSSHQQGGSSSNHGQERSTNLLTGINRGASGSSAQGFQCPNCPKVFARDDLLRRHLAREARAQAQPVVDRQKSCHECARSKARCDLEVPSCGRCKARGKNCVYGARSGNPNVRKGMRETQGSGSEASSHWTGDSLVGDGTNWTSQQGYQGQYVKGEGASTDEYESDDSHQWSDSFHNYRSERATSTSSTSSGSFEPNQVPQRPFEQDFTSDFHTSNRSQSPAHFASGVFVHPGAQNSHLARGFARSGARATIDTSVGSGNNLGINNDEGEVTPINRAQTVPTVGGTAMGPPQTTPTRYRDAAMNYALPQSELLAGIVSSNRPQPPRLLTGAKMPRPQDAHNAEQLGSSTRPLFSAQLDLSGWLEEPVIPSPLYRMGPSLSALQPGLAHSLFPPTPTNSGATAEALRNALAANPPLPPSLMSNVSRSGIGGSNSGSSNNNNNNNNNSSTIDPTATATRTSSSDTVMEQDNITSHDNNKTELSQQQQGGSFDESQVAARQWWAHSSGKMNNEVGSQGVAQACAGHFTLYPALMVLPDPTSPVPPLFHRPWLAHSRLNTPTSLARARVLLAGFHVKLPSSEGMVWDMIAMEVNNLIGAFSQHINATDQEVFSTTAALWFLIILLLMSSDPTSATNVPDTLLDSSLISLSHYSRLLCQRIKAIEQKRKEKSNPISFIEWGFEETMKRTLFASYSILVLQRFRESSTEIQSQLAGIDLILDVSLPATAMEFEAGNELEWRASQHVQITEPPPEGMTDSITIRDLLNARKDGETEESKKKVASYFDRHDDFTNVCLSVAFALDQGIS